MCNILLLPCNKYKLQEGLINGFLIGTDETTNFTKHRKLKSVWDVSLNKNLRRHSYIDTFCSPDG